MHRSDEFRGLGCIVWNVKAIEGTLIGELFWDCYKDLRPPLGNDRAAKMLE